MEIKGYRLVEAAFDPAFIKDKLRFFDTHGHVATLVERYVRANEELNGRTEDLAYTSGFGKSCTEGKITLLKNKKLHLAGQARSLVPGQVKTIMDGSKQLAFKFGDRYFRDVEEAEYDSLLKNIRASAGLWLSVYEPADLRATDGLKLFASMV